MKKLETKTGGTSCVFQKFLVGIFFCMKKLETKTGGTSCVFYKKLVGIFFRMKKLETKTGVPLAFFKIFSRNFLVKFLTYDGLNCLKGTNNSFHQRLLPA